MPLQDIIGRRFGRLRALRIVGRQHRHALWECACDCGNFPTVTRGNLLKGLTQSCGCWHDESARQVNITHGGTLGGIPSPEYQIWLRIIQRCENPRTADYQHYGGRGITISHQWRHDFAKFLQIWGLGHLRSILLIAIRMAVEITSQETADGPHLQNKAVIVHILLSIPLMG